FTFLSNGHDYADMVLFGKTHGQKLGKYLIFLGKLFTNPEKFRVYLALTFQECVDIGINSVLIVAIVSTFLGAVTCVQF
ncbi:MAG: hypothetical protein EAZ80_12280, partial [Runella slithyformis]